jgi:ParB-like chromosome segregation protein Spo0J
MQKEKVIVDPIIVEKHNLVILDGHHRTRALLEMGYRKIPAQLVDYYDSEIRVLRRRKNIPISKGKIIDRALAGKTFPEKTSKHLIPNRIKGINMALSKLT